MTFSVVLIEDNFIDANLTQRALKEFSVSAGCQFNVYVFSSGEAGLDFLHNRGQYSHQNIKLPDLILLDLKLPKMSGYEVLEKIKSTPSTQKIPVIVFTISGDEKSIERCLELKADDFIHKPMTTQNFTKTLCQLQSNWILPRL